MNDTDPPTFKISNEIRVLESILLLIFLYFVVTGDPPKGSLFTAYILLILLATNFFFEVYSIKAQPNGNITFKRLVRTKSINVNEIVSLKKGFRFERIYHTGGKITLSPFFTSIPELRAFLRESNPNIIFVDETENPQKVKNTILSILLAFIGFWLCIIFGAMYFL